MKEYLFAYGTLHPDRAPKGIRDVVQTMVPVGPGTIVGVLHDLGPYPAVTLDTTKGQRVKGTVFALPNAAEMLPRLDEYEGFLPNNPADSLFVRSKHLVNLDDGTKRLCWVYIYNRPIPAATSQPVRADKT